MPDVGVLNLSIKANAGSASKSLDALADALTRVKTAVQGGLSTKIDGVASSIERLKQATSGVDSRAITSVTNSITKAAENLTGNNAAKIFKNVASAIEKYVEAYGKFSALGGSKSAAQDNVRPGAVMKLDLGKHGRRSVPTVPPSVGEQMKMDLDKYGSAGSVEKVKQAVDQTKETANELESSVKEVGNTIQTSFEDAVKPIQDVKQELENTAKTTKNVSSSSENWMEAAHFANLRQELQYKALPKRSLEDYYNGVYWRRNEYGQNDQYQREHDFMSERLQGKGTETEQNWAIREAASNFGMTVDEAKAKIEELRMGTQQVGEAAEETAQKVEKIAEAASEAAQQVERISADMSGPTYSGTLNSILNGTHNGPVHNASTYSRTLDSIANGTHEGPTYSKALNDIIFDTQGSLSNLNNAVDNAASGIQQVSSTVQSAEGSTTDSLQGADFSSTSKQAVEASKTTGELTEKLKDVDKELKSKKPDSEKAASGFKSLGASLKAMFPHLANIGKQFSRILMRRAITAVIRSVTKAFSEGVENVYRYSQAIGSSFAPALDSAKSAMAQFKNSVGAAAAPMLQALIPVFNQIVNAAIEVINVINQLFALLTGQSTWTRALPQAASAFESTEKAAKGAGGAVKDMLADFDELNVLDQNSGGGGGGAAAAAADYENMFEEVGQFDQKIRDVVNFIKDNFETIKELAIGIGVAILGWKLAKTFSDAIPGLSSLFALVAELGIIYVTIKATWELTNKYLETGDEGWLITDILTTAVGSVIAAAVAKKFLGGAKAASWAAAITLTLSAVTGITALLGDTDVDALSKESILTAIQNAVKVGAGIAIVAKSIFGLSLGSSLLLGAGVAFATAIAVIGLKCLLQSQATDIEWGNVHLTEEQINLFVRKKMFTVDPEIFIKITSDNVKKVEADTEAISSTISGMMGTLNVIRLGLAEDNDYTKVYEDITREGGLIDQIQQYINDQDETAAIALKFMPTLFGSTTEEQNQWFTNNREQWETVKSFVTQLGEDLGKEFVEGENGAIMNGSAATVETILNQIEKISNIIAGSDVGTEALIDLDTSLVDFDKSTFNSAMAQYKDYKTKVRQSAESFEKTVLAAKTRTVRALTLMLEIDPDNPEIKNQLEQAKIDLKTIEDNYEKAIEDTFNEEIAPGRQMMQEWAENAFGEGIDVKWNETMIGESINRDGIKGMLKKVFSSAGIDMKTLSIDEILEVGGWELLSKDLQEKIARYVVVDSTTIEQLKDDNTLDINQILSVVNWDEFRTSEKFQFVNTLMTIFGAPEALRIAQQAGLNISDLVAEGMAQGSGTKGAKAATDLVNTVQAELDKRHINVSADASLDVKIEALVNVTPQISGGALKETQAKVTTAFANVKELLRNAGKTIRGAATGAYGIPSGELFIANEDGAELIGSMNGKTTVANQGQIIEGISSGVERANEEQNALLREQNSLLRRLLEKDATVKIGASAALGRTVQRSLDMYGSMAGG